MDPYNFLRNLDSRAPFLNGLNGLNPLSTLSGLSLELPLPTDLRGKGKIAREEAALEAEIVRKIASGEWEAFKPNSGKAISIGEHQICVAFHDDKESGYRIWEWHGHLLMFDDEEGYSPEYVYGNHFQALDKNLDRDIPVNFKHADDDDDEEEEEDDDDYDDDDETSIYDSFGALGLGSIIPSVDKKAKKPQQITQKSNVFHRTGNTDTSAKRK